MKKLIAFIVVSIAMVSCYEEYLLDYPYTGIYFYLQQDVRTFVVGEGMQFKVGATLGGVRQNKINRNVTFILDPALMTAARLASMQSSSLNHVKNPTAGLTALQQLPSSYYTLSNSTTMVIQSGLHTGTVTVKADSAAFLNDSLNTCRLSTYVLPFFITKADADTILESKRFNVVGVMFENMLFGNYWHGGSATVVRPGLADSTVKYYTTIPTVENRIWALTTVGPRTLTINSYFNATSGTTQQMRLVLNGNNVLLGALPSSKYVFEADGASTFNRSKLLQERKLFLKYKFTDPANNYVYHCTDTLTFRNRIRDGINEWQDENPSHYEK